MRFAYNTAPSSGSRHRPLLALYIAASVLECLSIQSAFAVPAFLSRKYCHLNMAPSAVSPAVALEQEDHARDAAFNKALHGKSSEVTGGLMAMRQKDKAAQKAAIDEYFKHWDNKEAKEETEEIRKARRDEYATLTRQYDLAH
jgi:hypothetical protein